MTPEERQRPLTIADLTIDIGATSKEEVIETEFKEVTEDDRDF